MSLVTIGACFGGIAFPPIIEILLRRCGYSGAMLPTAATMLLYCVCGLFYRPLVQTGSPTRDDTENKGTIRGGVYRKGEDNNGFPSQYSQMNGHATQIYTGHGLCVDGAYQAKPKDATLCEDDRPVFNVATTPAVRNNHCTIVKRTLTYCKRLPGVLSQAFGLHLLGHGRLAVFVILMASSFTCLGICNTFLSSLAAEIGVNRTQVAAILAVSSAVNIPCRFFTGVIFDLKSVRPHRDVLFGIVSMLTALVAILLPLSQNFFVMSALCTAHFFFGSSMHSQQMTVLSDLVESRQLASAMGLCRFFQGVGVIIGPVIGGESHAHYLILECVCNCCVYTSYLTECSAIISFLREHTFGRVRWTVTTITILYCIVNVQREISIYQYWPFIRFLIHLLHQHCSLSYLRLGIIMFDQNRRDTQLKYNK